MTQALVLPLGCIIIFLCTGCNAEIGNSKDVNPETVYTKYFVTCFEDDSTVSVRAQFTFAGPNGTTLVLNAPSKIELDGDSIHVDSTSAEGAFYEVKKPAAGFAGNHTLVFTGTNGVNYAQQFAFNMLKLAKPIPAEIGFTDLPLTFSGLHDNDSIHVRLRDTSSLSSDIDTMLYTHSGRAVVTNTLLQRLYAGPVTIELGKIVKQPMKNTTKEGGEFTIWYILSDKETLLKK